MQRFYPALTIGYFGSGSVLVKVPFKGTLIAPNGSINLEVIEGGGQHEGAFFAKRVRVAPDVTLIHRPCAWLIRNVKVSKPQVCPGESVTVSAEVADPSGSTDDVQAAEAEAALAACEARLAERKRRRREAWVGQHGTPRSVSGVSAAAEAMWKLNRYAKRRECGPWSRAQIYGTKNRFLAIPDCRRLARRSWQPEYTRHYDDYDYDWHRQSIQRYCNRRVPAMTMSDEEN